MKKGAEVANSTVFWKRHKIRLPIVFQQLLFFIQLFLYCIYTGQLQVV